MKKSIFAVLAAGGLLAGSVQGQILAWDTNGGAGNEATIASTTTAANLSSSSLSRGGGINTSSLGDAFSATDFTASGTLANAVTNNDFFQFTVAAQTGFRFSLSTLDVNLRRSSTGPNEYQWRFSLNNFSTFTDIGSPISFTSTATNGIAQSQINLSGFAALQNVAAGNTATFRLYAYGASATTGTFAIGRLTGNDLGIGGTVTAIPEPTSAALLALGGVTLLLRRSRAARA